MPNVYLFSKKEVMANSIIVFSLQYEGSTHIYRLLPWRSWINGNTVYFPQINETTGLNTGDAEELNKIAKATDNHLLTSVSMGGSFRTKW
jgi:hypothetical protein